MPQVTVVKIVEGESILVVRVMMIGDASPDLKKYVLVSPSDLVPVRQNNRTAFRLQQIWYGVSGFSAQLGYSIINSTPIWTLGAGTDSHIDFRSFGGLMDYATSPPDDVDGKLWISTFGLIGATQTGSLVISLAKTNAP